MAPLIDIREEAQDQQGVAAAAAITSYDVLAGNWLNRRRTRWPATSV